MNHKSNIQFDLKGNIISSENLPFEIGDGKIGDYFPMFSYLVPFYSIEEFTIDAYEFEIQSKTFIVDLLLTEGVNHFNLNIIDKTVFYSRLQKMQTELNEGKIQNEYLLVSQENLNNRVQLYESLSTHIIDNLSIPLNQVISRLSEINKSNDIKHDISFLKQKSETMLSSINSLQRYLELDPDYVKSKMESFSLFEVIQEIEVKLSSDTTNIKNTIDRNVQILTTKKSLIKLITTTLENLIQKDHTNIIISADKNQESMLEIGFSAGYDFNGNNFNKEMVSLLIHTPINNQEESTNFKQNNMSVSKYFKGSVSTFYQLSKNAKVILSFPDLLLKAN